MIKLSTSTAILLLVLRTIKRTMPTLAAVLLALPSILHAAEATDRSGAGTAAERMSRYNVVWNSPSKDATGVMPIGNGDIAAGVYAIEDGDLYLLLAKNDAYTYQGDIFKTGRVRISLDPNPFQPGKPFRQTLDLATGSIRIEADGVTLRIWADANRPVYHVEIDSPREIAVTARPEFWKRFDHCSFNVQRICDGRLAARRRSRRRTCGWSAAARSSGTIPWATGASIRTI